jgi:hypothetical protein
LLLEELRGGRSPRDCRLTGPIVSRRPELPQPPGDAEVGGVFVPRSRLTTTAEMSYVLNQQPGRLRIKDVKVNVSV